MKSKEFLKFSGSIGGNVGKSGGSIGGNVGKSGGSIDGNVGASGGSIGGNVGESVGGNDSNEVGYTGGGRSYNNNSSGDCIIVESLKEKDNYIYIYKLRQWRDNILAKNIVGRKIISIYYKFSPRMVQISKNIPIFKFIVRKLAIRVANIV